jgi:hypothetical protein
MDTHSFVPFSHHVVMGAVEKGDISAICYGGEYLYVGTSKGAVIKTKVTSSEGGSGAGSRQARVLQTEKIGKGEVKQLFVIDDLGVLLVLAGTGLHVLSSSTLRPDTPLDERDGILRLAVHSVQCLA